MTMHAADVLALTDAVRAIERPSVGARIANVVGSPIERVVGMLPARASAVISAAARKAIEASLNLSLRTLSASLFMHDGREVFVTFSAGVTQFRPGEALEAALERADEALYEAKRTGKNRTCIG